MSRPMPLPTQPELKPNSGKPSTGRNRRRTGSPARKRPRAWRAHVVLGAVHCSRFQWDEARTAFDAALDKAALETSEHFFYAAFLAATSSMAEAERVTRSRVKRYPGNPFAKLAKGTLSYLTRRSEFMAAEECAFAALRDDEELWLSYLLLACVRYSVGRVRGMLSSLAEPNIKDAHRLLRMEAFPGAAILCFCLVMDETTEYKERHARKTEMHQRIESLELQSRESYVAPFSIGASASGRE